LEQGEEHLHVPPRSNVRLGGKLHIIVVGHARLDELDRFSDAVVEDWKTEAAGLVPQAWIRGADT
jgi:hypothetical protein